jgi:hypothetical protein
MGEAPPKDDSKTIDIDDVEDWRQEPIVTEPSFDQKASLRIAHVILGIFGGVYVLCFVALFLIMYRDDATFEGMNEMVKFMMTSILPLVTLAVGYYLGEKSSKGEL